MNTLVTRDLVTDKIPKQFSREMMTVIECVSADGYALPPINIYKESSDIMGRHAEVRASDQKPGGLIGCLGLSNKLETPISSKY